MAARSPLSGSTPVNARSAQAPTTALVFLLLGAGTLMLGALLILAWSGRRSKDGPPEHEPTRFAVPWMWKVMSMVLLLVVGAALLAAAVIGVRSVPYLPGGVSGAGGGGPSGPAPSSGMRGGFVLPAWLPWTLLAIVVVAIAGGLIALWLGREDPPEVSNAGATRAAVEAAIDALDTEADPRRAVIAAYGAMQRTLSDRGVDRAPAEAPREYLERALVVSRATEPEVRTLTGLFEEARYSTHPIPESFRQVALTALVSLRGQA
jgi:hypothetical protein